MKKLASTMVLSGIFCFLLVSSEVVEIGHNQGPVVEKNDAVMQDARIILAAGVSSCGDNPVTGKVCVVTAYKQLDKVCKGDIVVTSAVNSRWYPLLAIAGGIITEKGSGGGNDALAFGKKQGIPVIVGAKGIIRKVVDGQIITLDPVTNNVYHVAHPEGEGVQFDTLKLQEKINKDNDLHGKLAKDHGLPGLNILAADDEKKEDVLQQKNEAKNKPLAQHINAPLKLITKMKILTDKNAIGTHILNTQAKMDQGKAAGKWLAGKFGVSGKAFDAMPVEYFTDSRKIKHKVDPKRSIGKLPNEEAVQYINQGTDAFIKRYKPKKMTNPVKSELAEFLHDRLVDHLDISDKDKAKAKKEPLELKRLLEEGKVDEELYEELTCRNLAIDYYVHKEVEK